MFCPLLALPLQGLRLLLRKIEGFRPKLPQQCRQRVHRHIQVPCALLPYPAASDVCDSLLTDIPGHAIHSFLRIHVASSGIIGADRTGNYPIKEADSVIRAQATQVGAGWLYWMVM